MFSEMLLREHSKKQTERITKLILKDPSQIHNLMKIFFSSGTNLDQRAAWVVNYISERKPEILEPFLSRMLSNLDKETHDAVRRNTLKAFINCGVPENLEGRMADKCFHLLGNPAEPVAVRVYAMKILEKLCKKYPELSRELKQTILAQTENLTPGFKSCSAKTLERISKAEKKNRIVQETFPSA